jgi:Gpi18-like mannosyltransferase
MPKSLKWIVFCVLGLASVHFARCYVMLTGSWINLDKYAAGTERMPFQGRMLMMWPLRWAEHNASVVRFSSHHEGAMKDPNRLVICIVALVCLIATGYIVTRLYEQASSLRLFPWLPYVLLLAISYVQYILHCEQNFLYPYDLLSLLFFTSGIWLIYNRRFWWLLLMFPVAVLNRETMIFLVPMLLLDACCNDKRIEWKNLAQPALLAKTAALSAIWAAIVLYVHHRYLHNESDLGSHVSVNIRYITHPQFWPQLFSVGAFLPVFLWYFNREIEDFRLRVYCLIFPLWCAVMFFYGMLNETRIFGELGGLMALVTALIVERVVWSTVASRLKSSEPTEVLCAD